MRILFCWFFFEAVGFSHLGSFVWALSTEGWWASALRYHNSLVVPLLKLGSQKSFYMLLLLVQFSFQQENSWICLPYDSNDLDEFSELSKFKSMHFFYDIRWDKNLLDQLSELSKLKSMHFFLWHFDGIRTYSNTNWGSSLTLTDSLPGCFTTNFS